MIHDQTAPVNTSMMKVHVVWSEFNPFMPNGISNPYQLDQSISILRVVGCYFSFLFLFVLLLYVPSQQLWSWRDGQFT